MSIKYDLLSPDDVDEWRAYHDIRRIVLFEARGQYGAYDETHTDEDAPGNHPKVLFHNGEPIGVIRIDIVGKDAIFRRVAIRSDVQRRGHGRALLSLAQDFARWKDLT